jgi:hypothetical protein
MEELGVDEILDKSSLSVGEMVVKVDEVMKG